MPPSYLISLPFEVSEHLRVSQEFSKIDMKQMTRCFEHDVIIVSVTDTQNVCDNTVSCTRCCKHKGKTKIIITKSTNQRAYLTIGHSELCANGYL